MPESVAHTDSLATTPRAEAPRKAQTAPNERAAAARTDTTAQTRIPTTDSLAVPGAVEESADWSTALPFTVYGTAEPLETDLIFGPVIHREASAKEIFGVLSTTAPAAIRPHVAAPPLTTNTTFQGFVLLLAATFTILLSRNLVDVRQLLSRISHDASIGQHIRESPRSSGFVRFLNITTTIGMLFMGVMAVKYIDQSITPGQFNQLPHIAVLGLSLLVSVVCAAIVCYQWLLLRLIGAVTLSQSLISQLFFLKRTFFSLAVILTSPVLLLYALCPKDTGEGWFTVVVIELAITVLLYLWESLNLFISKKISILHWFLYLCAVEIFPLSLLGLLAMK